MPCPHWSPRQRGHCISHHMDAKQANKKCEAESGNRPVSLSGIILLSNRWNHIVVCVLAMRCDIHSSRSIECHRSSAASQQVDSYSVVRRLLHPGVKSVRVRWPQRVKDNRSVERQSEGEEEPLYGIGLGLPLAAGRGSAGHGHDDRLLHESQTGLVLRPHRTTPHHVLRPH